MMVMQAQSKIAYTPEEYLAIEISIEHYSKSNFKQWIFSEYNHSEDCIKLTSIPCEIFLVEVYEGIELKTNSKIE